MSFLLKYKLEQEEIRNLELISKIDGNLQVLRMNPDWATLLEKHARLEEAVGSIGVEGTVISLAQARAITTGERSVEIGEKEEREFRAYYKSLEFIKNRISSHLTINLLLDIHKEITLGDNKALPGRIRIEQNAVKRHGNIIYIPPICSQLDFLLKDFLDWFNKASVDKNLSPVVAAAICHFWFVWIHPFADGNGRVARILTTFLLLKKETEGIRYFALSDYYNQHQDEYYDALLETNKCDPKKPAMNFQNDLSPWMIFFTRSYLKQTEKVRKITNRILQLNIRVEHLRKSGLITEKQNKALSLLYSREKASYEELRLYLGNVTSGRVTQILKPLRQARVLVEEKIGKRIWFTLGSPEGEPDEAIFKEKLKRKSVDKGKKKVRKDSKQAVFPIFED